MSVVPLIDALKDAKVPHSEEIADFCSELTAEIDCEREMKLSYVVAYTYDLGPDGEKTDTPYWIINDALSGNSILAFLNARKFIWGLLSGLRILPYKQFDVLYRGMNKHVICEEGQLVKWCRFTSTTRDKAVAERFLGISPNGEKEGTLITIKGGWGYDIEEFSAMPGEQEVLMEPGAEVFVNSVKHGSVDEIQVFVAIEGNLLLDHIPRSCARAANEDEESKHFSEAMDQKKLGNYKECINILRCLFFKGHREGMIEFAVMNTIGSYPEKNPTYGYTFLKQCEKMESGIVFYALGVCHKMGYGVEKDLETSNAYFFRSLLCGFPHVVQKCHDFDNDGVKIQISEVDRARYERVKREGRKGNPLYLGVWGFCLLHGFFEDKNVDEGYKLVKRSAERGSSFGQNILGDCYDHGWGVPKDVKKAFECYKLSAEEGDSDGQRKLGLCYQKGTGVDKDFVEAARLFKQSAEQDNPDSQYLLACCYLVGEGANQDPTESVRLFRLSAEQGHSDAQSNLGFCYMIGRGVEKDFEKALEWLDCAIEQGNKDAQAYKKILLETESEKGKKRFWIFGKKK